MIGLFILWGVICGAISIILGLTFGFEAQMIWLCVALVLSVFIGYLAAS